jgi:hypothetical protein
MKVKRRPLTSIVRIALPLILTIAPVLHSLGQKVNNQLVIRQNERLIYFDISDKKVNPKEGQTYYWTRKKKVHSTQSEYSGKLLHGAYEEFYPSGQLASKGLFKKGLKNGTWLEWHTNGVVKRKAKYRNGALHGTYTEYNEEGIPIATGSYKKGKKHGEWIVPDESGDSITKYKNGNKKAPKPTKNQKETKKDQLKEIKSTKEKDKEKSKKSVRERLQSFFGANEKSEEIK